MAWLRSCSIKKQFVIRMVRKTKNAGFDSLSLPDENNQLSPGLKIYLILRSAVNFLLQRYDRMKYQVQTTPLEQQLNLNQFRKKQDGVSVISLKGGTPEQTAAGEEERESSVEIFGHRLKGWHGGVHAQKTL